MENNSNKSNKIGKDSKLNRDNWDILTIIILVVAGFLILLSFAAPWLLIKPASKPDFDFSRTGQIGDTIGGISGPFIGVVGISLTFLAFYMQVKANRIQVEQFNRKIQLDEEVRGKQEKTSYLNKLRLLVVDLKVILFDLNFKFEYIKNYTVSQKEVPYEMLIFVKSPNKQYSRALELDRESVFIAFQELLGEKETWINDYATLYSFLEFLPDLIDVIYSTYDTHSDNIYNLKSKVREEVMNFTFFLLETLDTYNKKNGQDVCQKKPMCKLVKFTLNELSNILEKEKSSTTKEPDFKKLSNAISKFYDGTIELRSMHTYHDVNINKAINLASSIVLKINDIRFKNLSFVEFLKEHYNLLMNEDDDTKSQYQKIKDLKDFIEKEIEKVEL